MTAAEEAALAAALFAVDPAGSGGVCLRSPAHPARDQWLALLRELLPPNAPLRRVPFNIADARLLGGLDLIATLKSSKPIAARGVLAEAHGGVVIVTMAERLAPQAAARLGAVLDAGAISMPREGVTIATDACVGIVALDEGIGADERLPIGLLDRMAFMLDLHGFGLRTPLLPDHDAMHVAAARARLAQVTLPAEALQALCATALALGAGSPRVSLLAARVARAAAALAGRLTVDEEDTVLAGRLVLAPRATQVPAPQTEDAPAEPAAAEPPAPAPPAADQARPQNVDAGSLEEIVLAAVQAAIPAGLLAQLSKAARERSARSKAGGGRAGTMQKSGVRGRPAGVRTGVPGGDARLNIIETLRAAAPWQRLRGRTAQTAVKVRVLPEDFRVMRYQRRARTLTIFAVDASGSAALHRLAEAKGAVELLLADCYVRRDQVAVIAFRGRTAELLLPPTRSLVRAKRSLAGLPGGGGTPLAAAIDAAAHLIHAARRRGETPTLVLLSDGRANIARDGAPGRKLAHADAHSAARALGAVNVGALFVDTSPRPNDLAKELAAAMRATYVALPFANALALNQAVKAAAAGAAKA